MPAESALLLTREDLIEILQVSHSTVDAAARRGAIPGRVRVPPGAKHRPHRYSRRKVEDWITRGAPGLYMPRERRRKQPGGTG